ncbi:unnamed protein product [Lota lota]
MNKGQARNKVARKGTKLESEERRKRDEVGSKETRQEEGKKQGDYKGRCHDTRDITAGAGIASSEASIYGWGRHCRADVGLHRVCLT